LTYYESAEDIRIPLSRVVREFKQHGVSGLELAESVDEFVGVYGSQTSYDAQEVLQFLGY
jgi:hypothetical protein